jgi:cytochrome c oxidase assembly protein subunit 11
MCLHQRYRTPAPFIFQAGAYFNKIQCFCFDEQKLQPGEEVDMPIFFFIHPDILQDPGLKGMQRITLSYTFFMTED